MQSELLSWMDDAAWQPVAGVPLPDAQLVLAFAQSEGDEASAQLAALRQRYPQALVAGCSSGTVAVGAETFDEGATAIALHLAHTRVAGRRARVRDASDAHEAGVGLGRALAADDLALVLVLSDGLMVNGSQLAAGLRAGLGRAVPVAGGLAADGARFGATWTALDGEIAQGQIVAIGLYGTALRHASAAIGGWDAFGPRRTVTRAEGGVLHELDGANALDLYERYLGEEADALPGSALLYPLQIWPPGEPAHAVVRTVLAIDREARTMTFAGDLPTGWCAQLMRGHHERLVAGAEQAGALARQRLAVDASTPAVALLVSCVGRRLLMNQRTGEETEAVQAVLGAATRCLGFYSYGELSPRPDDGVCTLHNQTMTVTLLAEVLH